MKKGNWKALLPIAVFLVMYLGLGISFRVCSEIPWAFIIFPLWFHF